ncbi:MAG: ATP-dependent DNA helicase RecG, partial [Propionibacteriaceae bacterium]|nr:ATP-dependent DNA helicase RecG [Propionibacteriaceae bacterium]
FFGKDHLLTWWEHQLQLGDSGVFIGKVGRFRNELQMSHPVFAMLDEAGQIVATSAERARAAQMAQSGLVGMYPATAKLPTWTVAECARLALSAFTGDDPWPQWLRERAGVVDLATAFAYVHRPDTLADAERGANRLLFDEAMATQLTMAYRRHDASRNAARPRPRRPGGLLDAFDARLPFALTAGQREIGEEIFADLEKGHPMQRLLQGEVGSGKTLVALRAMLAVIDAGGQAALLAPTEVLANQHFHTMKSLLGNLGAGRMLGADELATDVVLITGSMTAVARRNAMLRAASGEAGIVVGTHALLGDKIQFAELGMLVIDEQHRFGVEQRALLADKASAKPHTLVLTATPIPRSVAMTIFGDLEVSTLQEIPAGRAKVDTVVVDALEHPAWVERAWARVREEVSAGRQAFIVCPRISVKNSSDQLGVEELAAKLRAGALQDLQLDILHGQLSTEAKDLAMERFASGQSNVLVATTMIEVGVDVPNASMMVIWDADRFGISQLHQLRGRIGRGAFPGVCLLVTSLPKTEPARERLAAVAATRDGFELADLDLAQRKEGDVLGASQSGSRSSLRLLRVLDHADLITQARTLAEECVAQDPACDTPGFQDAIQATELLAGPDWIDRS